MDETARAEPLFPGGGAAGALVRELDWSRTGLGPPRRWPKSLLAYVRAMLATHQPMCVFWGSELVNLYNDGFLPILGEKHPAAMGQRAEECWREAWSIVGPQLLRVLRGECILNEEVLVPIARGGRVDDAWFNYSYSPLFDDDGRPAGVLVICTEVTNEIRARREIEALAVQQATARKQAEVAKTQAETASRAKDEFLASVSHELRTPLNAILGWATILEQPGGRERVDRAIAIIQRNARAQAKIIDDILDVSRIISGKLLLNPTLFDVAGVIDAAVDSVRPGASAKGVRLRIEAHVATPWLADENRIQQVVWNLLSNAVKFTPAGGLVSVRATEAPSELRIRVTDTGKGISESFLPFVFDRFRQADATSTRVDGGLGLGLAIVRHLVELHGGVVTAASDGEGRGAAFEVVLPRRAVGTFAAPAPEVEPTELDDVPSEGASLRGAVVLVVDDERDARELTAIVLEDAGATVVQAENVDAALRALKERPISAIVSDIGMPGEDGYALLSRLRAETSAGTVPALALTAFARAEDHQRALTAGFRRHMAKPIEPARLVAALAALLRA
jgi:signal transduction histidine kinase/CheY-like chemotaxis protein